MSDENSATSSSSEPAEVCSAADAVKRAKEELEKAQAYYQSVRQQATERWETIRASRVGDVIDATLDAVRRHPRTGLTIAALLGFLLGRWFRRR
jgi:ElaB/YqjD/DUF883 family membrane-anchored ribosome-binding protein